MNKSPLIILALILFTFCSVSPQLSVVKMPNSIKMLLDQDYPKWKFPKFVEPWNLDFNGKSKIDLCVIFGDFDGDGSKDFAIQIVHPLKSSQDREQVLMAFLKRGSYYQKLVLETFSADKSLDIVISLVQKVSVGFDVSNEIDFTYPHDAIDIGSEKASHSYIYTNGKFETVSTGD
jgi:hypothetical protein